MKTAVSLPDRTFQDAERLRKRLGISRSEAYRRAIDEYVLRHSPDEITASLDRVAAAIGPEDDELVRAAARRILKRVEW
jgi:metal-responsive CopG/Arc/MetJ family transcriptional regulator